MWCLVWALKYDIELKNIQGGTGIWEDECHHSLAISNCQGDAQNEDGSEGNTNQLS